MQVGSNGAVVVLRIAAVDARVPVLDVYYQGVHHRKQRLHMGHRHIQRGFKGKAPLVAAQPAEVIDELRIEARFPAAERHTAIGREEIKFVNPHFLIQRLRSIFPKEPVRAERLWVKAVAAAQRATVKRDKRRHPVPIGQETMP